MPGRRNVACACGHEQQRHELGFGACPCGCDGFHLKVHTVEVLDMVEPPIYSPVWVAPLWRVRCPECTGEYETRAWRRELVTRRRCRKCADARKIARAMPTELRAPALADMSLEEKFAHGTRARYAKGCRCDECRAANNAYERMRGKMIRAGTWIGLVDAKRVRAHLLKLADAGVGLRAVADVARTNRSQLQAIRNGTKKRLLRSTADRILAVDALAAAGDGTLVDGVWTRRLIALLLEQGFTRYALAARLGSESKTPALQVAHRELVTAKTQQRVERLYVEIMGRLPRRRPPELWSLAGERVQSKACHARPSKRSPKSFGTGSQTWIGTASRFSGASWRAFPAAMKRKASATNPCPDSGGRNPSSSRTCSPRSMTSRTSRSSCPCSSRTTRATTSRTRGRDVRRGGAKSTRRMVVRKYLTIGDGAARPDAGAYVVGLLAFTLHERDVARALRRGEEPPPQPEWQQPTRSPGSTRARRIRRRATR